MRFIILPQSQGSNVNRMLCEIDYGAVIENTVPKLADEPPRRVVP